MSKRIGNEVVLMGSPASVQQLLTLTAAAPDRALDVTNGDRTLRFQLVKSQAAPADQMVEQFSAVSRGARLKVTTLLNPTIGTKKQGKYAWQTDPWGWDDNPWGWDDNPWGWDDNPWGWDDNMLPMVVAAGTTKDEGAAIFARQGAFQKIGLTDANGQRNPLLNGIDGAGVLVGLFDALPSKPITQDWLTLHAAHGCLSGNDNGPDLSDHGLMCASLVHAVAPKAQVHLFQACGQSGEGRLFPLLEAISAFIDLAAGRPAVLSLSLGSTEVAGSLPLLALLRKATDLGMVVCAAAGNRAYNCPKVSALQGAQIPSAFPNVIAVSASSLVGHRSQFAQRGDLAAPGGEALGQPGPDDADDIVGMGVSIGTSGYVRMDGGTSFATPLVAGAAALLLQGAVNPDPTTYARILNSLKAGARPVAGGESSIDTAGVGAGILYLPNLFNR